MTFSYNLGNRRIDIIKGVFTVRNGSIKTVTNATNPEMDSRKMFRGW